MKHWEGKKVVVTRDDEYSSRLYGTIQYWDESKNRLILQPGAINVLLNDILYIKELEQLPQELESSAAELNHIGYIMKLPVQFDNAILFGSQVMIWQGDRLVELQAQIVRHDHQQVVLGNGRILRKSDYRFIVRSLRGC
ncbi:hypothetical protein PO903_20445 [Paenibacillus sp. PK4536]|uniref:Uncharacterized protein n=1 Tax=Paenibacillus nuruki TaxID=1886670 RepID=A0A1E3KZE8_9BACL|nr:MULTISPECIES: hypothetical protein [Paenibacillus]ODP26908.1 hypothetical protein PTI45_03636 [Paenibacillus nuruki]TKJ94223.1 hypothetical protein PaeCFBP13512_01590 [Paenibacillus sp. CFBP13512]WIM38994.1 hypothetical protein PO903_20445 [Paenibacillus sp. PK4536]CAJ1314320.1 Lipoprotein [Paenibacillus nuruki]